MRKTLAEIDTVMYNFTWLIYGRVNMSINDKEITVDISHLSIEEKIQLLSDSDKDYLRGYIDRALENGKPAKKRKTKRSPKE
jgi:hypothetical protein